MGRRDGTKTVKGPYLVSNVEHPEAVKRGLGSDGLATAINIPLVNSTIQSTHYQPGTSNNYLFTRKQREFGIATLSPACSIPQAR